MTFLFSSSSKYRFPIWFLLSMPSSYTALAFTSTSTSFATSTPFSLQPSSFAETPTGTITSSSSTSLYNYKPSNSNYGSNPKETRPTMSLQFRNVEDDDDMDVNMDDTSPNMQVSVPIEEQQRLIEQERRLAEQEQQTTAPHLGIFGIIEKARIAKQQQDLIDLAKQAEDAAKAKQKGIQEAAKLLERKEQLDRERRLARLSGINVGQRLVEEQWLAEEARNIEAAISIQADHMDIAQEVMEKKLKEKARLEEQQIAAAKKVEDDAYAKKLAQVKSIETAKAERLSYVIDHGAKPNHVRAEKQQQIAADILKSVTANQIKSIRGVELN